MNLPVPIDDVENDTIAAEIGADLHRSLARSLDWVVRQWRTSLDAVEEKQRGYVSPSERDDLVALREITRSAIDTFERMGRDGAGRIDHLAPDDLTWDTISAEWARDEASGRALWKTVQQTARDELAAGKMGAAAVEGYYARPLARAQYLAVRTALANGLQPRNGMEWLLIDGMAEAWTMHLRWLTRHAQTDSLEAYRVERDVRQRGEWQPPRLSDVAAVDRAALMADRFQRQFLRLMRAYRDQRRLIASMTVLGGQVNLAEQQVNLAAQSSRTED